MEVLHLGHRSSSWVIHDMTSVIFLYICTLHIYRLPALHSVQYSYTRGATMTYLHIGTFAPPFKVPLTLSCIQDLFPGRTGPTDRGPAGP